MPSVTLNWTPSADGSVANIFRGTGPNGPFSLLASSKTSPYVDTTVVAGQVYFYTLATGAAQVAVAGVAALGNAAVFLGKDTTTLGKWSGKYGSLGLTLVHSDQKPAFASQNLLNDAPWDWATSTSDSRALSNQASCWYALGTFTIDLNLTDGAVHKISLYCLDWDGSNGRRQTVQVVDAVTGAILDSQSLTSFSSGMYLSWNISGHVKINVINTAQPNAVASGIFFD